MYAFVVCFCRICGLPTPAEIQQLIECKVCAKFTSPRDKYCRNNGHEYCLLCYLSNKTCPVCNSPHYPPIQRLRDEHFILIAMLNHSGFYTKTRMCSEKTQRTPFLQWKLCPYSKFGYCTWYGAEVDFSGLQEHLQNVHFNTILHKTHAWQRIYVLQTNCEGINEKIVTSGEWDNFLINAYDEWFVCYVKLERKRRRILISLYRGSDGRNPSKQYCFIAAAHCGTDVPFRRVLIKRCGSAVQCQDEYVHRYKNLYRSPFRPQCYRRTYMYCINFDECRDSPIKSVTMTVEILPF